MEEHILSTSKHACVCFHHSDSDFLVCEIRTFVYTEVVVPTSSPSLSSSLVSWCSDDRLAMANLRW